MTEQETRELKDLTLRELIEENHDALLSIDVEHIVTFFVTLGGPTIYAEIVTNNHWEPLRGKYVYHHGESEYAVELTPDEMSVFMSEYLQ